MITHTVAFRLNKPEQINQFLEQASKLANIQGVIDFRILKQVGKKNSFTHALSMMFESQQAYDNYDSHPNHQYFVNQIWIPQVADFIELDYVNIDSVDKLKYL